MRKFILSVTLVAVFAIAGCAAMDSFFDPGADGVSPFERMGRAGAPLVSTATGGPWSEIIMGGLLLVQNTYLLFRRAQRQRAIRAAALPILPDDA